MKMRLRQLQWKSAESGNVTMQIFLGKNILGQQDKIEQSELDESERVPNKERMKVISKEWKTYKETGDYVNAKEQWELKNTKISRKSKVGPVPQNDSDSDNSDNDDI